MDFVQALKNNLEKFTGLAITSLKKQEFNTEEETEEEKGVEVETLGCYIHCLSDGRCSTVCTKAKWVEYEYEGRVIEDYDKDDVEKFTEDKPFTIGLDKCLNLSKKYGVSTYYREGIGVVLCFNGKIGGFVTEVNKDRYVNELKSFKGIDLTCENVVVTRKVNTDEPLLWGREHRKETTHLLCLNEKLINEYREENKDVHVFEYIGNHPLHYLVEILKNNLVLAKPRIEYGCDPKGVSKGLYDEHVNTSYVDYNWYLTRGVLVNLGFESFRKVVDQFIGTVVHESAHQIDCINLKTYEGRWEGFPGLTPIPTGSEYDAEEVAKTFLDLFKKYDREGYKKVEKYVREEFVKNVKDIDSVKMARKLIEEIEKLGYKVFFTDSEDVEPRRDEYRVGLLLEKNGEELPREEAIRIVKEVYNKLVEKGEINPEALGLEEKIECGFFMCEEPVLVFKDLGLSDNLYEYRIPQWYYE